jgi:hypothetical protein
MFLRWRKVESKGEINQYAEAGIKKYSANVVAKLNKQLTKTDMAIIKVHDKSLIYIPEKIQQRIKNWLLILIETIKEEAVIYYILNGSFMFASDLSSI